MSHLPPVSEREVTGRKIRLGPLGIPILLDPNFYLPLIAVLVVIAVLAAYFSFDKPQDSTLAETTNSVSEAPEEAPEVMASTGVTFGVAGTGVSFTVELEKRIQDPRPLVYGVELEVPTSASDVEKIRTSFLNGLLAGDVDRLAENGLWFQDHASEMYAVGETTVAVEDIRIGLVGIIDNLARFPQDLNLVAITAKGPENPGLNAQSIDWLAISIQALNALGAIEQAQALERDAIVALSTAHLASQSPASVPNNSSVSAPAPSLDPQPAPLPEPILPSGVHTSQEVGPSPNFPLDSLNQSMIVPFDLDNKTWNFSPLSILSGIRDLFDLIKGNPLVEYWIVVGNETTSPNLVRMSGGLLPSFKLNYVTLQGMYPDDSLAGTPIVFLQFWIGPPPYEVGDELEVTSLLSIALGK